MEICDFAWKLNWKERVDFVNWEISSSGSTLVGRRSGERRRSDDQSRFGEGKSREGSVEIRSSHDQWWFREAGCRRQSRTVFAS